MKTNPLHTYMLYARVSPKGSDWNAEETSIALQIQEMKEYILRKDPQAEFRVQTDEFKSGKDLKRPGIQAILAELDSDSVPWGTLVVWALDRLSRSLADAVPIFEKLRDAECGFICIRQDWLSTRGAMARFTLNQTILIAQLEREMTSERVKAKMVYIAEKGKVPSGKIPLGYRRKTGVKNELEPDPETADIVRDIFKAYVAQTMPIVEIKKKYQKYIYGKNQLYRLLRNRLYLGEVEYDGKIYPGLHEPLIDRALFEQAATLLPGERRAPRPSRQKYQYLLQGLVVCHCGRKMTPYSVKKSGDTRYFYYKCQNTDHCKYAINAERLDAEILQEIQKTTMDRQFLKQCFADYRSGQSSQNRYNEEILQDAKRKLAEAQQNIDRIDQLFISGVVTTVNADYWNDKLSSARAALAGAQKEYDQIAQSFKESAVLDEREYEFLLSQIKEWSDILRFSDDFQIRRNLILSMVRKVHCVDATGKIELEVMIKGNKWRRGRDSNPR